MSKLLESEWKAAKTALLEGRDVERNQDGSINTSKRKVLETVLENTRLDLLSRAKLFESGTAGGTTSGNIASLNKVIFPIIRRVMPTVIANEIIGVQPMQGPIAQIHTLRVRYSDSIGGAAGVNAGAEALSPSILPVSIRVMRILLTQLLPQRPLLKVVLVTA